MVKKILLHGLLFALPFVVYALYAYLARRRARAAGAGVPDWSEGPWAWLTIIGLLFFVASFVALGLVTGGDPGDRYEPPKMEDGRVVPGRLVPPNAD